MAGPETAYLRELVGDALSRGCAATAVAQPNDPVEYLGQWLLRYVKNAEVEGKFYQEKQAASIAEAKRYEAEVTAKRTAENMISDKKAALDKLAGTVADPETLWQQAVDLVQKYTKASGIYLANIVEPEDPDWSPPEGDEAAEAETDDEVEEIKQAPEPESTGQPAEGEAEPAAESSPEPVEEAAAAPPAPEPPVDYTKKLLTYCISNPGQEFMRDIELHRPAPLTDEQADAGETQEQPAVTFRVLDEKLPVLTIPNVAFEPRVKFFKKFPKVGAYQACAVSLSSGEYRQILCADTLLPEGSGKPFTKEEQDFIWQVALSLSKAIDGAHSRLKEHSQMAMGGDEVAKMRAKIKEVYFPPPPPAADPEADGTGEPGTAPAAPAAEEPAAPAAPAAAPAEGEAAPAEAAEPSPEELEVKRLQEELAAKEKELEDQKAAAASALTSQQTELQVLTVVKECISGVEIMALRNFRMYTTTPKATFHILKAILLLLGVPKASTATWKLCMRHVNSALFSNINSYDATQERDLALWKQIRSCYKAVSSTAELEKEMPSTHLGVMLLRFIKQVRRVAKATAALHTAEAAVTARQTEKEQKAAELEAAQKAQADAEAVKAAAAAAAQAEAEAAAAAAAAEGAETAAEPAADE